MAAGAEETNEGAGLIGQHRPDSPASDLCVVSAVGGGLDHKLGRLIGPGRGALVVPGEPVIEMADLCICAPEVVGVVCEHVSIRWIDVCHQRPSATVRLHVAIYIIPLVPGVCADSVRARGERWVELEGCQAADAAAWHTTLRHYYICVLKVWVVVQSAGVQTTKVAELCPGDAPLRVDKTVLAGVEQEVAGARGVCERLAVLLSQVLHAFEARIGLTLGVVAAGIRAAAAAVVALFVAVEPA